MNDSSDASLNSEHVALADCWNKIGVRGDSSCPELARHIHCRNCPVYSAAAADLLDAELPKDYRAHWSGEIAQEKTLAEFDTHAAVVFRIDAEWYALATTVLQEIVSVRMIHSIPHRRDGVVLGLVNIRGELLACFSLRKVLGVEQGAALKQTKTPASGRLLVIQLKGDRAVCPVDEVYGIARYRPSDLSPVPATIANATVSYSRSVLSWRDQSVGLLNEQLIFSAVNRGLA